MISKQTLLDTLDMFKDKLNTIFVLKKNVVNNDTTTDEGYIADARAVQALGSEIDTLNTKIETKILNVNVTSMDDRVGGYTIQAKRSGNTIILYISLTNINFENSNLVAGGNFDMFISGIPLPSFNVTTCTYMSTEIYPVRLQPNGMIRIRNRDKAISYNIFEWSFTFTYIV